jgi:hypothetical protein
MENFKIKAITDTVIKHLPVDSKQLSESQKFSWYSGSELEINSYTLAPENHWELELKLPREGVSKWFAYQPHVEILGTVLDTIKKINTEFPSIGVYHRPNDQDRESAGSGRGIFPCGGKSPCAEQDNRSEKIYLPFVMATRRQTDAMVRQAYLLLPEPIRQDTAFLIADRLIQSPEAYIPYIQQKKNVVLIGSFMGLDKEIANLEQYKQKTLLKAFHDMEIRQLEYSIDLVKSLDKAVIDVVCAIGDSPSPYADKFRSEVMEKRLHELLKSHGLGNLARPLTWGADDTTLKAFARQLPNLKLKVIQANSKAKHHYDAYQTTEKIVEWVTDELGITKVEDDSFDAQVFIFDRHPNAPSDFNAPFSLDDPTQKAFDQDFAKRLKALPENQQAKTIIIDGRNPNGAFNSLCIPPSDKFLGFGSWGTFGNVCAQTLAMAKILHFSDKPNKLAIQRQLLLEAVAHDIFIIGYADAQNQNSALRKRLAAKGLRYIHKEDSSQRYQDVNEVQKVYQEVTAFVSERMAALMPEIGNTKFAVVPQLWRMFESQVYASDGELSVAGVYREDLPSETFDPFQSAKNVKKFGLDELIHEKTQG